jgi:hypothetical protein
VGGPEWQPLKLWRKKKSFSGRKEKRADIFVESLKKGGGGLYRNDVTHFKSKKKTGKWVCLSVCNSALTLRRN